MVQSYVRCTAPLKAGKAGGNSRGLGPRVPFPVPGPFGAQNGPKDPNNATGPTGPNGPSDPNDLTGPNGPNDPDDQNNPTMNQCRHFIIKKKNIYYLSSYPVAILLLHVLLFSSYPAVTLSFV